jgi:hypothetical protein
VAPPQNAMSNTMFSPRTDLRAYHGDPTIKATYLARVRAHRAADDIIQKQYGSPKGAKSGWRGCAVGCTLHDTDHGRYESDLGIPVALAHLQDRLFELMPLADAKDFPREFLEAIPIGADLSLVPWQILAWGIERLLPLAPDRTRPAMERVISEVLCPLAAGQSVPVDVIRSAHQAAVHDVYDYAAYAAYDVAAFDVADAADAAGVAVGDTTTCAHEWKEKLLELLAAAPTQAAEGENR